MRRNRLFKNYITTHFEDRIDFSIDKIRLEFNTYDRNFKRFLPSNKNVRILEIGFGSGYFIKYLLQNNYRNIYGIELSSEATEFVKKNIYTHVECIVSAEDFLDEHQNKYDFIYMSQVLEHIPKNQTVDLLKKIGDALIKNGTFIACVPNANNPFNIRAFAHDFTHEFIFNPESLKQICKIADFSKIEIFPLKEENISWHGKITNITSPIMHFIIKIFIGLNRCYLSPSNIYTANIYCVCKK